MVSSHTTQHEIGCSSLWPIRLLGSKAVSFIQSSLWGGPMNEAHRTPNHQGRSDLVSERRFQPIWGIKRPGIHGRCQVNEGDGASFPFFRRTPPQAPSRESSAPLSSENASLKAFLLYWLNPVSDKVGWRIGHISFESTLNP